MTYTSDEYNFLCVFFAACRDALQQYDDFEEVAELFNSLGEAVFHEEKLSVSMLKFIEKSLIYSFWIDNFTETDETYADIQRLRQKALLHTVAMLKEAERG